MAQGWDGDMTDFNPDLHGLGCELSNGAEVFGSISGNSVIWVFKKDDISTQLLLSHEAVQAMMGIWQNLRNGAA